ncbi:fibronectin type III domain protein [Leadbettera azotonutricia ZAS-9]|uniref:Fibronectin type III domain protein n=1 Tax=Leadbettera azotonutricia (strain ATCC BAA-888 / DSM 13862 / ZAS-9) TaxID=545695 RepID=F5YEP3_LEAAZ|nr:fibronectin type III domain protein [Leadbettera azotonutricia ZAS-9]
MFALALVFSAVFFPGCPSETRGDDITHLLPGPRSIQVTARNESLVLQWTKIVPAQGIVPYYGVYYSSASAIPESAIKWDDVHAGSSQLVTSTITGLVNEISHYVWVKAIYPGLGNSDFTPVEVGIPIPPPQKPGSLTVIPGEEMLEITWTTVAHAFTYEVYYKADGTGVEPPPDTAETMKTVSNPGIVLLGLTNTTNYAIWVRALNTAGNSPAYSTSDGIPQLAVSVPGSGKTPDKPSVVPGNNKLALTWNQVLGISSYKLYYNTSNDFSTATPVAGTIPANAPAVSAEITGLVNDMPYYVWVASLNLQGESPASESASGTPKAKDPINFSNLKFALGTASAEYIFAVDLPPSVFFPDGRPNTDRLTRVQETALGNLFTDGVAWYVRNKLNEPIDFVFINGGLIDNVLPRGTVTVGTVAGITQPDARTDKIFLLTMKGDKLKLFFEDMAGKETTIEPGDVSGVVHTGRGGPHNTGFFGTVSKEVRYTLQYYKAPEFTEGDPAISSDISEPYYHGFIKPGTLTINGVPINDSQDYRICTTDYLAAGEYFTGLYTDGTDEKSFSIPFWHGVAEYIYDQGTITPYLDGRIKIEGGVPLPPPWIPGDLVKP